MSELAAFEARLGSAVRRYLEDAPLEVDAASVTRRVTSERQRRRFLPDIRLFGLSPAAAWLLVVALLALAAVAVLVAGAPTDRDLPGLVPPVSPVVACPAGSTPDRPGPATQDRPFSDVLRMVFDRAAGRIVALAPVADGSGHGSGWDTWIFDVCTNTWARAASVTTALGGDVLPSVAYDADAGVTVAIDRTATPWVYDLDADTWTRQMTAVEQAAGLRFRLVEDPLTGLVYVLRPSKDLWTYDVEPDTWAPVRHTGAVAGGSWDTSGLYAFDQAAHRIVAVLAHPNQSATGRFDPRSGEWTAGARGPKFNTGFFASGGEIAFDEASKRIVVFSDGHIGAYDTTLDTWETIYGQSWTAALPSTGPQHRQSHWMVYDPRNERLVVAGGDYRTSDGWVRADDVWAFDTATREWIALVAPSRIELYDDATDTWRPVFPTPQP